MRNNILKPIATLFGLGYIPVMPGTFASATGLLLYLLIGRHANLYFAVTVIAVILGFYASDKARIFFAKDDPRQIVIDELCGILITYLFIPFKASNIIIGFILFRTWDILKIYPLKRLERLRGGWGIMLDDIAAALIANGILQVLNRVSF